MFEIVEDLLSEDNVDFMISPWLPLTLVYLNDLVDLNAASELFDKSGWPFLVSVRETSQSELVLTRADFIRQANVHAVESEPLRYVELDGKLMIADYEKFFAKRDVDLSAAIGFLND